MMKMKVICTFILIAFAVGIKKAILSGFIAFVWWIIASLEPEKEESDNMTMRYIWYFAIVFITLLDFIIILNQYFGIKLSDLIR